MEQLQSHNCMTNGLLIYVLGNICAFPHILYSIRKLFLIYDFATAQL